MARLGSFLRRPARPVTVVFLAIAISALLVVSGVHALLFASLKPVGFTQMRDVYDLFAKILGGLLVMVGLLLTFRRLIASEKVAEATLMTAKAGLDSQITDRFSRAIDQLGSEKLEIRLGGVYSLERISKDSDRDYWTVMSVLSVFVREHSPNTAPRAPHESRPSRAADIGAVLSVFARRGRRPERFGLNLNRTELAWATFAGACLEYSSIRSSDLSHCDLRGAVCTSTEFSTSTLTSANLTDADLTGAHFIDANLERAVLLRAKLRQTVLIGANLSNANLSFTDLTQSVLTGANMTGAKLVRARLPYLMLLVRSLAGADLRGVDLSGQDLRFADLNGADFRGANLAGTQLPPDLSGAIFSGESTRELTECLTARELRQKIAEGFGLAEFLQLTEQEQATLVEISQLDALDVSPSDGPEGTLQ